MALVVPLVSTTAAAQQLLANGDFDSGIDGWTLGLPVPSTGAELSWDPSLGDAEPGSLRLEGDPALGGQTVVEAWSPCFELDPEHLPRLEAQMRRASSDGFGRCMATFIRYDNPGCSGDRSFTGGGLPQPVDVWLSTVEEWGLPPADTSYRVALTLAYVNGTAVCNFDSVRLTLDGIAAPTLGSLGIAALIAGVAAGALVLISRIAAR